MGVAQVGSQVAGLGDEEGAGHGDQRMGSHFRGRG
jgi:hypothetical protein